MGDYEKRIIYINSENGTFLSSTKFNMTFDLAEFIKDIAYIKLLKSEIIINVDGIENTLINNNNVEDGDPVFINLNEYNRISTRIGENTVKYFDIIHINLSEKFGNN